MPQLAQSVVGEAELVVREGRVHVEGLLGGNADFQLVLSSSIRDDFPVVDAAEEGSIGHDGSEVIVGLVQESMPEVSRERDFLGRSFLVPAELAARLWVQILNLVLDGVVSGARKLLIIGGYLVLLFWSVPQLRVVRLQSPGPHSFASAIAVERLTRLVGVHIDQLALEPARHFVAVEANYRFRNYSALLDRSLLQIFLHLFPEH